MRKISFSPSPARNCKLAETRATSACVVRRQHVAAAAASRIACALVPLPAARRESWKFEGSIMLFSSLVQFARLIRARHHYKSIKFGALHLLPAAPLVKHPTRVLARAAHLLAAAAAAANEIRNQFSPRPAVCFDWPTTTGCCATRAERRRARHAAAFRSVGPRK